MVLQQSDRKYTKTWGQHLVGTETTTYPAGTADSWQAGSLALIVPVVYSFLASHRIHQKHDRVDGHEDSKSDQVILNAGKPATKHKVQLR